MVAGGMYQDSDTTGIGNSYRRRALPLSRAQCCIFSHGHSLASDVSVL